MKRIHGLHIQIQGHGTRALLPTALDSSGTPIDTHYTGQLFGVGDFLVALITFIIVAFVIFLLVKITKKWGIE